MKLLQTELTCHPLCNPRSAPLQVQRPAGQLWHVSACGEEVPVWLVQRRGPVHHEAALPSHLSLR